MASAGLMALPHGWRLGVIGVVLPLALVLALPLSLTPGVEARLTEALGERFGSASLGSSPVHAVGGVLERPGGEGRTVVLDVTMGV